MGYIKVAHRKILKELDNYSYLPNRWNEFVKEQEKYHNLIIKSSKNKCHCTNCGSDFISLKKINEETKCPNCKNKYLIKRSNLRYFEFKDYLALLDKVENTLVIRYFELKTIIDAVHEHHSSVAEFAREVPTDNWYRNIYVNERVAKCQCHIYIYHSDYFNRTKWREYTRNYSLIDYAIVFPNNIKKLLQNTDYKYSHIWDIAKNSQYIDLKKLLSNKTDVKKIEMLSKMKLYNLALKAEKINYTGSFEKTFGVPKMFYPFMKRHNITYIELQLLQLLKEPNINSIRYLKEYTGYFRDDISRLEEISNYISLSKFIKYSKLHRGHIDIDMYKDYLKFAKTVGLDLKNKRYIYPENLKEEHDKLEKQYEICNKKEVNDLIIKRSKILDNNSYNKNNLIVFPAHSLGDLIDESKQQSHCVRTYAEKYSKGECDIYFLRNMKDIDKSLVTIEVKDNKIIQSKAKHNNRPNENYLKFIKEWEQKVLKGAA
ncbi:MAG: PcfJ domain-containing protein [Clostridia bacterium]|nr:PcfJ domain-containing protein [Clostridia bacterium]MBP3801757.1 PcfJ domain-containing protein [Clostridia bacterium]